MVTLTRLGSGLATILQLVEKRMVEREREIGPVDPKPGSANRCCVGPPGELRKKYQFLTVNSIVLCI